MNALIPFLETAAYVIAIALQVTAALLLVGHTSVDRKKIIKAYCDNHKAIIFKGDGSLLNPSELNDTVNTVWINRLAFGYLFLGYLVGIFGECPDNKWLTLLVVLALLLGFYCLTLHIAKRKSKDFSPINREDLPDEDGLIIIDLNE